MDVLSAPPIADMSVRSVPGAKVAIRFDVVKQRAAEVLGIPLREVTHERLADLFGVSVRTIGRYAAGRGALLETATEMSTWLNMPIGEFTSRGESA